MKTFINAKLVLPDGVVQNGFLKEKDGKIHSFGNMDDTLIKEGEIIDCSGRYLSPGFVDIHTHGGGGHDYMDGAVGALLAGARTHLSYGATTIFPTTLTSSDEDLFLTIDNFRAARAVTQNMPHLEGLHLEGPYFNESQKGAQDNRYLRSPEPAHYMKILEYAGGLVRRWSLAPELPGALEMADRLSALGVMLSAAHTCATYDQISAGFDHGIRHLTHLYSGMSTITRRDGFRVLGAVEAAFLIDGLNAELIADGMHLPPELLRLILRCKRHSELCLCTDSMRGAGMPEGPSILGSKKDGQEVVIEGGVARMPDRSCFAGSVATCDRLVRVMVYQAGLPVWEAVRMMSLHPAQFIGCDGRTGSISVGKDADLILFDNDIRVSEVYVSGVRAVLQGPMS